MSKDVTMIALSKTEYRHAQIPDNCEYLNHVSVFQNHEDAVVQMVAAVSKVETPFYFFCDDDDPAPKKVPIPKNGKGILYGDMYSQYGQKVIKRNGSEWSADKHITNPMLVHKAVCRTDYTMLLSTVLPTDKVWFELLYYYFLADFFGAEYNPDFQYIWQKHITGMHTTLPPKTTSTGLWIRDNRDRVKSLLNL